MRQNSRFAVYYDSYMNNKKKMFIWLLVGVILIGSLAGVTRTRSMEADSLNGIFRTGTADILPDGFWKGSSPNFTTGEWQGKRFDAASGRGVNVFKRGEILVEAYPFVLRRTKGVRDTELSVIKVDYALSENPWYLRWFGFDEIVRIDEHRYLGKIQLAIIPNLPFTVGYFWQEQ